MGPRDPRRGSLRCGEDHEAVRRGKRTLPNCMKRMRGPSNNRMAARHVRMKSDQVAPLGLQSVGCCKLNRHDGEEFPYPLPTASPTSPRGNEEMTSSALPCF